MQLKENSLKRIIKRASGLMSSMMRMTVINMLTPSRRSLGLGEIFFKN